MIPHVVQNDSDCASPLFLCPQCRNPLPVRPPCSLRLCRPQTDGVINLMTTNNWLRFSRLPKYEHVRGDGDGVATIWIFRCIHCVIVRFGTSAAGRFEAFEAMPRAMKRGLRWTAEQAIVG